MLPCFSATSFHCLYLGFTFKVTVVHERDPDWPCRRFHPILGGEGDAQVAREGRLPGFVVLTRACRLHGAVGLQGSWALGRTGAETGM